MNAQENTKIVQKAYENFKTGDIQTLLGSMSEDVEWQLPEIENVPFAGKRAGVDEVAQFFQTLGETQETRRFEPRDFIAEGDRVVVLGNYQWGVKATNRDFESDFAHVFTIRDGKIVGFKEFLDTAAASAAHQKAATA